MGKIVTERHIEACKGILTEGGEAYIQFMIDEKIFWMYGILLGLTGKTATIKPVYGKGIYRLKPEQLLKITDTEIPSEIVDRVFEGEIIEISK